MLNPQSFECCLCQSSWCLLTAFCKHTYNSLHSITSNTWNMLALSPKTLQSLNDAVTHLLLHSVRKQCLATHCLPRCPTMSVRTLRVAVSLLAFAMFEIPTLTSELQRRARDKMARHCAVGCGFLHCRRQPFSSCAFFFSAGTLGRVPSPSHHLGCGIFFGEEGVGLMSITS